MASWTVTCDYCMTLFGDDTSLTLEDKVTACEGCGDDLCPACRSAFDSALHAECMPAERGRMDATE